MVVAFAGCGGGGEKPVPNAGRSQDAGRVAAEPMPDRQTEPLKFYTWRVDQLFIKQDADGDGRLDAMEYGNSTDNFQRIDANKDGFVTKQEVLDDLIPKLKQSGEIP